MVRPPHWRRKKHGLLWNGWPSRQNEKPNELLLDSLRKSHGRWEPGEGASVQGTGYCVLGTSRWQATARHSQCTVPNQLAKEGEPGEGASVQSTGYAVQRTRHSLSEEFLAQVRGTRYCVLGSPRAKSF